MSTRIVVFLLWCACSVIATVVLFGVLLLNDEE